MGNDAWSHGVGTSIARGVDAIAARGEVGALVVCVCDQPAVTAVHLAALAAHWHAGAPVVASSYAGAHGVPALFDRSLFGALTALAPGAGAKSLLDGLVVAHVALPGGEIDVDTPADVERLHAAPGR